MLSIDFNPLAGVLDGVPPGGLAHAPPISSFNHILERAARREPP